MYAQDIGEITPIPQVYSTVKYPPLHSFNKQLKTILKKVSSMIELTQVNSRVEHPYIGY